MIMQPHLVTAPSFRRQCRNPIDIAQVAILLDVDGTILDVAATPQSVAVPASLVRTLGELRTGALPAMRHSTPCPPAQGSLSGTNRSSRFSMSRPLTSASAPSVRACKRHAGLSAILKEQVTAAVAVDPRIIVEDKGSSLAVHYRLAPELGPLSKKKMAAILDRVSAEKLGILCGPG
jgi:trehalose 6-phosphate phosphatase